MKNYTKQLKKKYKKSKKIKYKFNKTKRKSKKNKKGGMHNDDERCQEPSSNGWPYGYGNVRKLKDKPCSYFFWPNEINGNYYALRDRNIFNRWGDSRCTVDGFKLEEDRICKNNDHINKKIKYIQDNKKKSILEPKEKQREDENRALTIDAFYGKSLDTNITQFPVPTEETSSKKTFTHEGRSNKDKTNKDRTNKDKTNKKKSDEKSGEILGPYTLISKQLKDMQERSNNQVE